MVQLLSPRGLTLIIWAQRLLVAGYSLHLNFVVLLVVLTRLVAHYLCVVLSLRQKMLYQVVVYLALVARLRHRDGVVMLVAVDMAVVQVLGLGRILLRLDR